MADDTLSGFSASHPAPERGHVDGRLLAFGLLGAPFAWALYILFDYGIASHACYPSDTPLRTPMAGWEWVPPVLRIVNIAALVVAAVAVFVSYRNWTRTRGEAGGGQHRAVQTGEGRTRFLAVWGMWGGLWFVANIAFATIAVFAVPLCGL